LAYLPPAQYDHPYSGTVEVVRVSTRAEAKAACPNIVRPVGCARSVYGKCLIFVLPDAELKRTGFNPEYVLKHEIAHCNGWPGEHPGARTEKEYLALQ
jgi:hypothetical protein